MMFELTPLWWRIPSWAALTAYTAYTAPSTLSRVLAAVLMGVGAVALQFAQRQDRRSRQVTLLLCTVTSLAACFAAHDGLAEILTAVAASRFPEAFDGRALRVLTIVDSVAFGGTVAYISGSAAGALAGLGIPMLVQRALERRELVRERDRAQALLAEAQRGREAEAQAAALQERSRIAREMHDVLAHSLAGLSVQLQATKAIATRENAAASVLEPLDKAATLAREGLTEARAAVGALRDPAGLGVDALPALVDRHPGTVALTVLGAPGRVSPQAGHAVYRAVQEALTNATRYAPGSRIDVTAEWSEAALTVAIDDDGPAPGRTAVTGAGTNLGLAGMTERIEQVGGAMTAGPRPGGGWRVVATVPTSADVPVGQP